ncbi:hypothetical protein Tco_1120700, partial [Tanacetum coccineum]
NRVLDLETTKTAQAKEIADLKIESSDDEETVLGDQEDASKQGRRIVDIDEDIGVTLDNTIKCRKKICLEYMIWKEKRVFLMKK